MHDLDVRPLVVTADVVDLSGATLRQAAFDRTAMIVHVQPVSNLHSVAVDRKFLAMQDLHDHQGNQLLRKLVGTVVVRAVGRRDVQTERVVVRPDEMITRRLAGRIRRVWLVLMFLRERRITRRQRSVDLVGRDVMKSVIDTRACQPYRPCRLQQGMGSVHIG